MISRSAGTDLIIRAALALVQHMSEMALTAAEVLT